MTIEDRVKEHRVTNPVLGLLDGAEFSSEKRQKKSWTCYVARKGDRFFAVASIKDKKNDAILFLYNLKNVNSDRRSENDNREFYSSNEAWEAVESFLSDCR